MPRSRNWHYRDTFNPEEQGGDECWIEPRQQEPHQEPPRLTFLEQAKKRRQLKEEQQAPQIETPAQARGRSQVEVEPKSPPAGTTSLPEKSLLVRQGSSYVPENTDEEEDENEWFIKTSEHIDEYDDRDMEGVEELRFEKEEGESPEEEPIEMRDFMRLLRKGGGVFVSWRLREIVNTGDAAIVLGRIMDWFDTSKTTGRTRPTTWRHGRNWLFKTHAELGRETGLKPRQVRTCLSFLERKKFIAREYHLAYGMRTTYISLNPEQVYDAMWEMERERRENVGAA